ncbi:MAG: branched-chain amino acid ABC transporter permease [Pseudomonadota bacterium]
MWLLRWRWFWPLLGILIFAIVPVFFPAHHITILTELLIFGLFAMSLDILLGYTGMISFGHAAYFGVGAYASAIMLLQFNLPLPLAVLAGALAGAIIAFPVGYLSTRATGVYFAMLTLAFAQMIYAIVFKWYKVTGGSDGIVGVPRSELWFHFVNLGSGKAFYYFVFVVVALSIFVFVRILRSPFGKTLQAIRENEKKVESLGINTRKFKVVAFIIAAFFGGISGALFAPFDGFASPELLFWAYSGSCLIMLVIGGVGTIMGAYAGATVFILLEEVISSYTKDYLLIVGIIFILVVLLLPGGVVGFGMNLVKRKE